MASFNVLYIVVYLETGFGIGSENRQRLKQMADLILSIEVPFIAIDDWNELPQALIPLSGLSFFMPRSCSLQVSHTLAAAARDAFWIMRSSASR